MDPNFFGDSVPYGLLPFVIQQLPSSPTLARPRPRPTGSPLGTESFIRRLSPPVLDDGPHLSYAIQWFSFATIILVGSGALMFKRRPGREVTTI